MSRGACGAECMSMPLMSKVNNKLQACCLQQQKHEQQKLLWRQNGREKRSSLASNSTERRKPTRKLLGAKIYFDGEVGVKIYFS